MSATSGRTGKAATHALAEQVKPRVAVPTAAPLNRVWSGLALGGPARLLVSPPNDPLERAADATAERVLRAPSGTASPSRGETNGVRAGASVPRAHLPASNLTSGSGEPLDAVTRSFFEPRFERDLSDVRVHRDASAAASARAIDAKAFTYQNHIAFSAGRYEPASAEGKRLLAHELAHVTQGAAGAPRVWRKGEAHVEGGEALINPPEPQPAAEEVDLLQVVSTGMDSAALVLGDAGLELAWSKGKNNVFIGLHPKFVKVYDSKGKALGGKIPMKDVKGIRFTPGVYAETPAGKLVALTISADGKQVGIYSGSRVVGMRDYTKEEQAAIAEEVKKAEEEARPQRTLAFMEFNLVDLISDPAKMREQAAMVPDSQLIVFVPTYEASGNSGKGAGGSQSLYASPIEGRGDGLAANAPPWPVSIEGPKLVPLDSTPTFEGKVDWTANGNDGNVAAQVISIVGESIHYQWELYDITDHAKKVIAKDPANTQAGAAAKPERTLEQRIDDFKNAKEGTGTDVTGMGGANREFSRDFEDWWKDTKRASGARRDPNGDTVRERMSSAMANELALELAPVALLTTAFGAVVKWAADLFAGPRQQQEVPLATEGTYLIRVITTPGVGSDMHDKPVIRPPSVAARVVEVTTMDKAVEASLDEPGTQLLELKAQIDVATAAGETSKAEYLRSLLAEATLRYQGTPLALLTKTRDDKQAALDKFRKEYPTLSDYSRVHDVDMLNDQIALYERHERERKAGAPADLAAMKRANATLISEVTGEQYPLLISVGPMASEGGRERWMVSDVTNRDGDAYIGLGATPSEALQSALNKFGGNAAYGRGRMGLETAGLGLESGAPSKLFATSAPADWALAEKRIDDLVMTLAMLGLLVASAGTAGALIGAGVAAARLIQRWQAGKLYLDAQTVSDALGVLGGLGAGVAVIGALRVQKFEKLFVLAQDGGATEAQIARAAEVLKGAQEVAKGVELANEAINYAGLLWGNISFFNQMIEISEQETSGAITHAAARRARATAISSAVQNNGLFIAGNVMKARAAAKEKPTAPEDKPLIEKGGETPQPEATPLSERRATLAEMKVALPADLRDMVVVDEALHGDSVQAEYTLDPDTGLISEIKLRCGPDARPATVSVHAETIRTMQKYQGFSGRVRQAISWVADIIGVDTLKPENKGSFEAALEIRKLPKAIELQMARMRKMEPNARNLAEAELAHLQEQLEQHMRALDLGDGEGVGFVAAKGLSKAKQKQYADLLAKLRKLTPGEDAHREVRREMYELIGGDMPPETWNKVYDANVTRATKANASVASEHERLGWGKPEQTIELGNGESRRLDIADKDPSARKGVEVKAYETGYISASEEIRSEVERDAKLVRRGWKITWILIDTTPSGPLLKMLLDGRITVELRTMKGGPPSTLVTQYLPQVAPVAAPAGQ